MGINTNLNTFIYEFLNKESSELFEYAKTSKNIEYKYVLGKNS